MNYASAKVLLIASILIDNTQPVYCQGTSTQLQFALSQEVQDQGLEAEFQGALPSQLKGSLIEPKPKPIDPAELTANVSIEVECDSVSIDSMRGLMLKVTNKSKHPVLVDCDAAKVIVPAAVQENSALLKDVEDKGLPPSDVKTQIKRDVRDTLTAAVTVGAVQTVDGIKTQHAPILDRYGTDEKRRQIEVTRFGKRILWPGEVSSGMVYFNTAMPFSGGTLEVPLSLPFRGDSDHVATISTKIPASLPEPELERIR